MGVPSDSRVKTTINGVLTNIIASKSKIDTLKAQDYGNCILGQVLLVDFNSPSYCEILINLHKVIKNKRRGMRTAT